MPTDKTYNRILAYLKGLLSDRQRHDLEKDMMRDVFEEEAFEGLGQLSGRDLEEDMELLQNRLDSRILPARKDRKILYFRLAAGIALLAGIGGILYFITRTPGIDLITEKQKIEKTEVHPAPPSTSVQSESENERKDKPLLEKKAASKRQIEPVQTEILTDSREEVMPEEVNMSEQASKSERKAAAPQRNEVQEPVVSAATERATSPRLMKSATAAATSRNVYSGTVVDNSGETIPGVVVTEIGTNNGTVTDENGYFNLSLRDTNSRLTLNFIGYKPVELEASGRTMDKIVMEENLVALDEVVVVGYGTQKKNHITGAVSTIQMNEETSQYPVFTRPVPPGGSLRAFKKWVNDRLNYTKYTGYPGKHKIAVELTVYANGTISDIRVEQNAPEVIAEDLKNIISQSSLWTAGLKDDKPVETEVEIHFVITVE